MPNPGTDGPTPDCISIRTIRDYESPDNLARPTRKGDRGRRARQDRIASPIQPRNPQSPCGPARPPNGWSGFILLAVSARGLDNRQRCRKQDRKPPPARLMAYAFSISHGCLPAPGPANCWQIMAPTSSRSSAPAAAMIRVAGDRPG